MSELAKKQAEIPKPPDLPTCFHCKWMNKFDLVCFRTGKNKKLPEPATCNKFQYDWGVK